MLKNRIKDCRKINKNIKLLYQLQYLEATSAHVKVNKLGQAEQHGVGIGGWLLTQLHSCANSFMKVNEPFTGNPNAHRHSKCMKL